jgi:hypothetical protein
MVKLEKKKKKKKKKKTWKKKKSVFEACFFFFFSIDFVPDPPFGCSFLGALEATANEW